MQKPPIKVLRVATVPISMNILLKGQLEFLNQHYEVIGATSSDEKHFKEVQDREQITVFPIPFKRKISPFADVVALLKLYQLIRREKPQIVHSITPKAGLLAMIAAYLAKVPVRMHMFTGLIFPSRTGISQKILIAMDKLLCKAATNIYPEGQGVKNDLIKFNITDKPLKILANGNVNGINTDHFKPTFTAQQKLDFRKANTIAESDIVFCFVGRLCIEKGIRELVAAFVDIMRENPRKTVKLLLVGPLEKENGALPQPIIAQIDELPEILAVGRHDDIRPYLEISDIFVFPSYREGFPNVVLQAGAMELPCIVSDINGCNEIIVSGHNGVIIPARSTKDLFEAMQDLLVDDIKRRMLAQNLRHDIFAKYRQEFVWNALLEEYKLQLEIQKVHV